MIKSELVLQKVWRSEIKSIALFLFFGVLCVVLSREFPGSVMTARLFSFGGQDIYLSLPLWWFVPFLTLSSAILRIYNVRYCVDRQGVEAKVGILSFNQRITRVRYEDIRSIETEQTLLERMLDIGTVEISTAGTSAVEIIFEGVAYPSEIRNMLNRERDGRQKATRASGDIREYQESSTIAAR